MACLCKQLRIKAGTLVNILNAQKKWMRQEDATYVAVHYMHIRENEAGFRILDCFLTGPFSFKWFIVFDNLKI